MRLPGRPERSGPARPSRLPSRSTTLPRILRRFYYAVAALAAAVAFGAAGFRYGCFRDTL